MSHEDVRTRATTWWASIPQGKGCHQLLHRGISTLRPTEVFTHPSRPGTVLAMSVPAETLSPTFSLL